MNLSRVGIIGSGNFGSCIARLIASNLEKRNLHEFDKQVHMWVYDEIVDGESIIKIINEKHENVKYLPGYKLGNVIAIGSVEEVTKACDYLVFVTPHQFLPGILEKMKPHLRSGSTGMILTKGINFKNGEIELLTDTVEEFLGIKCGALMGGNIANEIAAGCYCESTLGFPIFVKANSWKQLFDCETFKVSIIDDIVTLQLSGTMKNIVAIGGGIVDGLGMGQSTKAAVLRLGAMEIFQFADWYFPGRGVKASTMMESCGFGDIVASSYGGRNRRCAEHFVKTGKSFEECEKELLNGQKLQGTLAAEEVYHLLECKKAIKKFPLLTTIYMITKKMVEPGAIIKLDSGHLDRVQPK